MPHTSTASFHRTMWIQLDSDLTIHRSLVYPGNRSIICLEVRCPIGNAKLRVERSAATATDTFRERQPFFKLLLPQSYHYHYSLQTETAWLWSCSPVNLHIAGASTIYSAQQLLRNLLLPSFATFGVQSVTVDCNIGTLGCCGCRWDPVEMLQDAHGVKSMWTEICPHTYQNRQIWYELGKSRFTYFWRPVCLWVGLWSRPNLVW